MYISCEEKAYKQTFNQAIIIDGIIGAGKTTLGHFLSGKLELPFYQEIEDSTDPLLIQRMLDKFYQDPLRWSAMIQIMFLNHRFSDIVDVQSRSQTTILDRSIYGDEVFARNVFDRQEMTKDEFLIYQATLRNMLCLIDKPRLLIFLDVSVDTAMERIKIRDRSTESSMIPRDYMVDLKSHYDDWYKEFNLCKKLKIDFNSDIQENLLESILLDVKEALK